MVFCLGTVAFTRSSIRRRPPRRPRRRTRQLCPAIEKQSAVKPQKKRRRALNAATFRKWITRFLWRKLEMGKCDIMQLSLFKIGQVKLRWIDCRLRLIHKILQCGLLSILRVCSTTCGFSLMYFGLVLHLPVCLFFFNQILMMMHISWLMDTTVLVIVVIAPTHIGWVQLSENELDIGKWQTPRVTTSGPFIYLIKYFICAQLIEWGDGMPIDRRLPRWLPRSPWLKTRNCRNRWMPILVERHHLNCIRWWW